MASVIGLSPYRKMTVEEFLALEFEGRAELADGVFYMMSGGSPRHSAIAINIGSSLRVGLRGSGCRPYSSDLGVKTGPTTIRLPDVSVYCGNPPEMDGQLLGDPVLIVEVLSSSTKDYDQSVKLLEYRDLPGTDAILLVDPETERVRLIERTGPDAWTDRLIPKGEDVVLAALGITLPHAELFAED